MEESRRIDFVWKTVCGNTKPLCCAEGYPGGGKFDALQTVQRNAKNVKRNYGAAAEAEVDGSSH